MENSPITLLHWHTEPALIGGILFVGWVYSLFIGPYRANICPELPNLVSYSTWFSSGLITFYLAVGSPLDPLGENFLFSAHMIQHNILMYICPLFILLGLPKPLVDHFFIQSANYRNEPAFSHPPYHCRTSFHPGFFFLACRSILRGCHSRQSNSHG